MRINQTGDIGFAVHHLIVGQRVAREGWSEKGAHIEIRRPMRAEDPSPYVEIRTNDGECLPWTCSQSDLLAQDWFVVNQPAPTLDRRLGISKVNADFYNRNKTDSSKTSDVQKRSFLNHPKPNSL